MNKKFLLDVKVVKSFKHFLNSTIKKRHNSSGEFKFVYFSGKFDFKYLNKLSKTLVNNFS